MRENWGFGCMRRGYRGGVYIGGVAAEKEEELAIEELRRGV